MRLSKFRISFVIIIATFFIVVNDGRAGQKFLPLMTVPNVELTRYMGVWYEIARLDHFFQKGCLGSTATYVLKPDGEVEVLNRCVNEKDHSMREAKGRAWLAAPGDNSRLKVSFFWPFRTDYWIIDLGKEYEYAVVGDPDRKYLWVLSRTPAMDDAVYKKILDSAAAQGFAIDRLVRKPLSRSL